MVFNAKMVCKKNFWDKKIRKNIIIELNDVTGENRQEHKNTLAANC